MNLILNLSVAAVVILILVTLPTVLERNAGGDLGSSTARARADLESAAQQRRPFSHAQQAHRLRVRDFFFGDAAAIVADFQNNPPGGFAQFHLDVRGAGMANDVGESFLEDAEKSGVQIGTEAAFPQMNADVAFDAGACLKIVGLPFEGGSEAKMIEHSRTEFGGDAAHHLDR
jgi:hypothetical protein